MNKIQIVPAQPHSFNPPKVISNNIAELQINLPGFPIETSQENVSPENQKHALYFYYLTAYPTYYKTPKKEWVFYAAQYFLDKNKNIDFKSLKFQFNGKEVTGVEVLKHLKYYRLSLQNNLRTQWDDKTFKVLKEYFPKDEPLAPDFPKPVHTIYLK